MQYRKGVNFFHRQGSTFGVPTNICQLVPQEIGYFYGRNMLKRKSQ